MTPGGARSRATGVARLSTVYGAPPTGVLADHAEYCQRHLEAEYQVFFHSLGVPSTSASFWAMVLSPK
jgi:hypothetical protein